MGKVLTPCAQMSALPSCTSREAPICGNVDAVLKEVLSWTANLLTQQRDFNYIPQERTGQDSQQLADGG